MSARQGCESAAGAPAGDNPLLPLAELAQELGSERICGLQKDDFMSRA
jgi:hypothetical protein